jgi:hypothetical protein
MESFLDPLEADMKVVRVASDLWILYSAITPCGAELSLNLK